LNKFTAKKKYLYGKARSEAITLMKVAEYYRDCKVERHGLQGGRCAVTVTPFKQDKAEVMITFLENIQ